MARKPKPKAKQIRKRGSAIRPAIRFPEQPAVKEFKGFSSLLIRVALENEQGK